jgi:hypothetical protein
MEEVFFIIWRNELVGILKNSRMDMSYLEGNFVSNNSGAAKLFQELVSTFNIQETFRDFKKATRVVLKNQLSDEEGIHSVVLELDNDVLSLRNVFDKEAIKILLKTTQ